MTKNWHWDLSSLLIEMVLMQTYILKIWLEKNKCNTCLGWNVTWKINICLGLCYYNTNILRYVRTWNKTSMCYEEVVFASEHTKVKGSRLESPRSGLNLSCSVTGCHLWILLIFPHGKTEMQIFRAVVLTRVTLSLAPGTFGDNYRTL